jgi:hypothetical protein
VNASQIAWSSTPTLDDLKSLYNFGAHGQAINASTTMRCELQVDGFLENCAIMREKPMGFAFGAASVRAATLYRAKMTEALKALVAAGGVSIIIPSLGRLRV